MAYDLRPRFGRPRSGMAYLSRRRCECINCSSHISIQPFTLTRLLLLCMRVYAHICGAHTRIHNRLGCIAWPALASLHGVLVAVLQRAHVCMHACMHVCVCVCMYVCMYIYIHTYMCMYIYIYILIYIHMYMYIYIYIHTHTCTYTYTYTYIYIYTCICMNVYIHIDKYKS
jgi:hypothetical protein